MFILSTFTWEAAIIMNWKTCKTDVDGQGSVSELTGQATYWFEGLYCVCSKQLARTHFELYWKWHPLQLFYDKDTLLMMFATGLIHQRRRVLLVLNFELDEFKIISQVVVGSFLLMCFQNELDWESLSANVCSVNLLN